MAFIRISNELLGECPGIVTALEKYSNGNFREIQSDRADIRTFAIEGPGLPAGHILYDDLQIRCTKDKKYFLHISGGLVAFDNHSVITRLQVEFISAEHSNELAIGTRALVKHKDGHMEFAYWLGDKHGWCDEGSYNNCGGIGGDITKDVVEFSANDW